MNARVGRGPLFLGVALALLLATARVGAVDPSLPWKTLSSPHFNLHFHPGEERLAPQILSLAERVHERLTAEFGWVPKEKTEIVLTDEMDLANGFSTPFPFNKMQLNLVPPHAIGVVDDFDDWYEMLLIHEYTHILHLDKVSGSPGAVRGVLGRNLFTFPSLFQPSWMHEGLATWYETDLDRGVGRGQSAVFAMMMRAEVMGGIKPFDQVSMGGLTVWPQGHVPYLYGVHFFQFLEERYGRARVKALLERYSANLVPYLFHSNFRRVLGKDTPQLWREFSEYLEGRYAPQLAAIRAQGVVQGERTTDHAYRTASPRAGDAGAVWYIRDDDLAHPALMRWTPGEGAVPVTRVHPFARIDYHPEAGILLSQPEVVDNYQFLFDLYRVDPDSGRVRRLTRGGRYSFGAWDPTGEHIAAVQVRSGQSRLLLLDAEGRERAVLREGRDGEILSKLDFAPDGRRIALSVWRGRWDLEVLDLDTGQLTKLTDDSAIEGDPQYTPDGRYLLFSSDHGGTYNLRRLELASGALETLTNVETGAFDPTMDAAGVLTYLGYGPTGYDLYRMNAPAPVAPLAAVKAPARLVPAAPVPEAEAAPMEARDYTPWPSLKPTSWFPVAVVTDELFEVGASIWGADALAGHRYTAALTVEANFGLLSPQLGYVYHDRLALTAGRRHVYDHTGDGVIKRIRQVDLAELALLFPRFSLDHTMALHLGVHGSWESEAHRESGVAPFEDTRDTVAGVAFTFDSTEHYPRAVSRGDGREIRVAAESSDAFDSDYSGEVYVGDWREFFSLGRHVLAVRAAQGWGTDRPRPFELGGAATGLEDLVLFRFNQRRYPLRGYPSGLAELTGRRFRLGSLEWRFPIREVERAFRRPPLGLHRLSGNLFVDAGATWEHGGEPEEYRRGVGLELMADTNLFYLMDLDLRLGLAHGLDDGGETQVYLTLGSEF